MTYEQISKALQTMNAAAVARATGLAVYTVKKVRAGKSNPTAATLKAIETHIRSMVQ